MPTLKNAIELLLWEPNITQTSRVEIVIGGTAKGYQSHIIFDIELQHIA